MEHRVPNPALGTHVASSGKRILCFSELSGLSFRRPLPPVPRAQCPGAHSTLLTAPSSLHVGCLCWV